METKEILNLAIQKKLCQPWQEKMKNDSSIENLCQMYFDGDDWAIKMTFPQSQY